MTAGVDPRARHQTRRALVQALYQWQISQADPADIEVQFANGGSLERADRSYFHLVLRAVIDRAEELDDAFRDLLDRQPDELDIVERGILRAGAFELRERKEIPYRVVIDEWVGLAKIFGAEDSHKYVNGVLDALSKRERSINDERI